MAYIDVTVLLNFIKVRRLLVVLVYICHSCGAHLVRQRLRTPCGGSTLSSSVLRISTPSPHASPLLVAFRLWQAASDVTEAARHLRYRYLQERIQSGHLQNMLLSNTMLPGFPSTRQLDTDMAFIDRLTVDFDRVAMVAIFIGEIKHEEEQSLMSPTFLPEYETLESQIYPLLCWLKIAIRSQSGALPEVNMAAETVVASGRGVSSSAERYSRDYKVLSDSVLLFESIRADYEFLHVRRNNVG